MTRSAADEVLVRTGHQGAWLEEGWVLAPDSLDAARLAVIGNAYDGLLVATASPSEPTQLVNLAADGTSACSFSVEEGTVSLGPVIPLEELVADLCADIEAGEPETGERGVVIHDATLAALVALFGDGSGACPASEASVRLGAVVGGMDPGQVVDELAAAELVTVGPDRLVPGATVAGSPELSGLLSGHRLDLVRSRLAAGGSLRHRTARFCGPRGERLAILNGPEAGTTCITRMAAVDLAQALAGIVADTEGPQAPLQARPATAGGAPDPATSEFLVAPGHDLDAIPADIVDVIAAPAAAVVIWADDHLGRHAYGASVAEGRAVCWDSADAGLVLRSAPLGSLVEELTDQIVGDELDALKAPHAVEAGSPADVLTKLPPAAPDGRRRTTVTITARTEQVTTQTRFLVLSRGAHGAWIVDLDDAEHWSPEPATRSSVAAALTAALTA